MTHRLVNTVAQHWAVFDGWLASRNIEPMGMPPDRFLALAYYWLTRNAEEAEVRKFDTKLWMPPKGVKAAPESPWSPEAETSAFKSLKAQLNPGKVGQPDPTASTR